MNYSAYLFDFDYTLADSSKGIVKCYRIVLEQHGFRGAMMDCVIAAWRKNQELGKS